ncbi:MAG TPA: hypothetical protein VMS64_37860 [Candidatus Methylomirabilis sp.]|nr:hypothetical protein [Candidatus Methylomirabilis sp.]
MTPRVFAAVWLVVALVFGALLVAEIYRSHAISAELAQAEVERQRLTAEIRNKEQELTDELRKHADLVQDMQWTSGGGDPSAFLARLADLAREKRMTIMAVGSLERQVTPQFAKSWHPIQVRAPYREIRELATRVEQDRGNLEDVHIEPAAPAAGQPQAEASTAAAEVQARFNLTTLELSPQAKLILERTRAASEGTGTLPPKPPLSLPVPSASRPERGARDPFAFLTPPPPTGPVARPAEAPVPDLVLRGIVSFPEGFLAIVNDQIVKVGDTVSGYRVRHIGENSITLAGPDAAPRTIELPEPAPVAPPPPRR